MHVILSNSSSFFSSIQNNNQKAILYTEFDKQTNPILIHTKHCFVAISSCSRFHSLRYVFQIPTKKTTRTRRNNMEMKQTLCIYISYIYCFVMLLHEQ